MGDEDLRDLFALGILIGQTIRSGQVDVAKVYEAADLMIEEKYREYPKDTPPEEVGIAAVVKRTRKKHG
jgi:hypothetical protein